MKRKSFLAVLLAGAVAFSLTTPAVFWAESSEEALAAELVTEEAETETGPEEDSEFEFPEWTEGAPALEELKSYVDAVTDENSADFIPEADRIAVFDMDGTVYGELAPIYLEWWMFVYRVLEDPTFEADEEMTAVAEEVKEAAMSRSIPEGLEVRQAQQQARAFAGMTLSEYRDYVTAFLLRDVWGFEGMTYAEAFYLPMIEVVDYLKENDFTVYLVSGSDRFLCRTLIEGILDIPEEKVIGMDVRLEATGQQGADGLEYVFDVNDDVLRTDILLIKNVKMNKVVQIAQEIGRQPVLSFGNSSGDTSMAMYVTHHNKYKSEAFMLVADDGERDWANPEKAKTLREVWEGYGWTVISMKDDFRTIYGDDVIRMAEMPVEEETETETETETEAATEAETETENASEVETETEAATEAETETEAESEAETEAATEVETETVTEAAAEAETETEVVTEAATEVETETEAATEAETEKDIETIQSEEAELNVEAAEQDAEADEEQDAEALDAEAAEQDVEALDAEAAEQNAEALDAEEAEQNVEALDAKAAEQIGEEAAPEEDAEEAPAEEDAEQSEEESAEEETEQVTEAVSDESGESAETAPEEAAENGQYIVGEGDNLWKISEKVFGSGNRYKEIAELNGLEDPYELELGQVLMIPDVGEAIG